MLTLAVEITGVLNVIPGDRIVGYLEQLTEMEPAGVGNLSKPFWTD